MKSYAKRADMEHATTLEAWVDVATSVCASHRFPPGRWPELRRRYGTVAAMKKVIRLKIALTPLCRLKRAGLSEWSVEAGVLRFPDEFTEDDLALACFRLDNACDPKLR
jgi:hypothetical protein